MHLKCCLANRLGAYERPRSCCLGQSAAPCTEHGAARQVSCPRHIQPGETPLFLPTCAFLQAGQRRLCGLILGLFAANKAATGHQRGFIVLPTTTHVTPSLVFCRTRGVEGARVAGLPPSPRSLQKCDQHICKGGGRCNKFNSVGVYSNFTVHKSDYELQWARKLHYAHKVRNTLFGAVSIMAELSQRAPLAPRSSGVSVQAIPGVRPRMMPLQETGPL